MHFCLTKTALVLLITIYCLQRSKLISRILGVSDSLVFPPRNVPTFRQWMRSQIPSLIHFLYSYSRFIFLLLLFVSHPHPLFVIYFFLDLLIFDNPFSDVILQFISSLFSLTVKMLCLTIFIYCYKGWLIGWLFWV